MPNSLHNKSTLLYFPTQFLNLSIFEFLVHNVCVHVCHSSKVKKQPICFSFKFFSFFCIQFISTIPIINPMVPIVLDIFFHLNSAKKKKSSLFKLVQMFIIMEVFFEGKKQKSNFKVLGFMLINMILSINFFPFDFIKSLV